MKKLVLLLLFLSLFLSSCTQTEAESSEIFAMDTFMQISVWGDTSLLSEVTAQINALDAALSVTREDSELSALNTTGNAELSDEVAELLQRALALSEYTGGAFDPTVYPLVRAWGFTEDTQQIPDDTQLAELTAFVGAERVSLNGSTATLQVGTMLDFGGIAKGYAAQRCAEILQNTDAALLVLGGNVQTIGSKPDGSDWKIGIADPQNSLQAIAKLRFQGSMAVVTSGSYERYFEARGTRYHHILDPKTGYPVENEFASVTIITHDGVLADALSTALFVMGLEQATQFWRSADDFEAVFVLTDGSILATEGAAPLLYDCEFTVIER